MSEHMLPWPVRDVDHRVHTDAPSPELIDLVAALNQMGCRLPRLTEALEQLCAAIPGFARDAVLGRMTPGQWAALTALLEAPAEMLADLARLCREHA